MKASNKSVDIRSGIRHLGVYVERVNDGVKLIAEQYGSINKKLDTHTAILDKHSKILDSHTEMIGNLTLDVSIIKQDVEFIKSSFKRKIDVEEFSMLEHRVALLEKRR